jgi:hypothetical protein
VCSRFEFLTVLSVNIFYISSGTLRPVVRRFLLVPCLAYSYTLKMEWVHFSETLARLLDDRGLRKLRACDNRMARSIFVLKKMDISRRRKRSHNEELRNLYSSQGDEIKRREVNWGCSIHGINQTYIQSFIWEVWKEEHFGDLGGDGKVFSRVMTIHGVWIEYWIYWMLITHNHK